MDEIQHILLQILDIVNEMSPYLLLGFLLAGLMHSFIPGTLYSRYLS
ncbi:MAG: permease, partial [Bacteroidaceae bacterium]|nr:permease [Bacteroidaceae bacterium]